MAVSPTKQGGKKEVKWNEPHSAGTELRFVLRSDSIFQRAASLMAFVNKRVALGRLTERVGFGFGLGCGKNGTRLLHSTVFSLCFGSMLTKKGACKWWPQHARPRFHVSFTVHSAVERSSVAIFVRSGGGGSACTSPVSYNLILSLANNSR